MKSKLHMFAGWGLVAFGCLFAAAVAISGLPHPFFTPVMAMAVGFVAAGCVILTWECKTPALTLSLPAEIPADLLQSMVVRYDHALGSPGYYDQELFAASGLSHAQRLAAAETLMKQLYEEVREYAEAKCNGPRSDARVPRVMR